MTCEETHQFNMEHKNMKRKNVVIEDMKNLDKEDTSIGCRAWLYDRTEMYIIIMQTSR